MYLKLIILNLIIDLAVGRIKDLTLFTFESLNHFVPILNLLLFYASIAGLLTAAGLRKITKN